MAADSYWYEAAFVVGITNALNVVADGLITPGNVPILTAVNEKTATGQAAAIFNQIREFHQLVEVPVTFRIMAADPQYLADFWTAWTRAFTNNRLARRLKESLAFAVSLTTRSPFGTAFHVDQMRRLGVTDAGIMEVLGVTQMFSSYTKIADTLQLEPDMSGIAPADTSAAPSPDPE